MAGPTVNDPSRIDDIRRELEDKIAKAEERCGKNLSDTLKLIGLGLSVALVLVGGIINYYINRIDALQQAVAEMDKQISGVQGRLNDMGTPPDHTRTETY